MHFRTVRYYVKLRVFLQVNHARIHGCFTNDKVTQLASIRIFKTSFPVQWRTQRVFREKFLCFYREITRNCGKYVKIVHFNLRIDASV